MAIVPAMIGPMQMSNPLRIPSIVAYTFMDQHNSASFILSAMQLIGILAGLTFWPCTFVQEQIDLCRDCLRILHDGCSPFSKYPSCLSALFSGYTSTVLTMVFPKSCQPRFLLNG